MVRVNIPKMFSIAILKFQNSKKLRNQVRDNSKQIYCSYTNSLRQN